MTAPRIPISADERMPLLDARREAKMTSSAHAYVRGSTHRFYEWLLSSRGKSLPHAPSIWIGGDCHLGNIGPIARIDGQIDFELRDLDQTIIGSPAHDIVRLALSMAMAVRASNLPGRSTLHAVEAVARGYEMVLEAVAARRDFALGPAPTQLTRLMRTAKGRSRRDLFLERIGRRERQIPIGKRFWPLTEVERSAVEKLAESERFRKLMTSLTSRGDDDAVTLVDAAYWVKGCSSLGLWRCAALIQIGKGKQSTMSLVDIKEAIPALAPHSKKAKLPAHQGERVAAGARALSPHLGGRILAATLLDKPVFVRELLPQDLKLELDSLTEDEGREIGRYLASVVAIAHARQLEPTACADWLLEFRKHKAAKSDAPSWLWAAVVDLVALHEGAYLEHCREHPPIGGALAEEENDGAQEARRGEIQSHHVETPA